MFKSMNERMNAKSSKQCRKFMTFQNGVIGIVGPSSPESAVHVRSICDAKEIPLIETSIGSSKHVVNLHPTSEDLGHVYLDMIYAWDWDGFTIIYQDAPW